METLFSENGIHEDISEWVMKRKAVFIEHINKAGIHETHGLREFLLKLNEMQIPFAIASGSGKSTIQLVLSKIGLLNEFKVIVGAEDVSNTKPHPEVFLKAAEKLGVSPARCVAIEDSKNGIESALSAGMRVVCMQSRHTKNLKYNLPTIRNFDEFPISVLKGNFEIQPRR